MAVPAAAAVVDAVVDQNLQLTRQVLIARAELLPAGDVVAVDVVVVQINFRLLTSISYI